MRKQKRYNFKQKKQEAKHRINDRITIKEVRLVGENIIGKKGDIVPTEKAKSLAKELGLDLVEINSNSNPSIVEIMDYDKFIYEQKKREKEMKKKAKDSNKDVKEYRFSLHIAENDVNTQKNKILKHVEQGHKIKMTLILKGRDVYSKDSTERAGLVLLKVANDLADHVKFVDMPTRNGRNVVMNLAPKK